MVTGLIAQYAPRLMPLVARVADFASKTNTTGLVGAINFISTASIGVNMITSFAQGQAVGGVTNFLEGVADVTEERYYDNGGDQSGTLTRSAGGIVNDLINVAYTSLRASGKLFKLIPGVAPFATAIDGAMLAWNGASLLDEGFRGDGDGLHDTVGLATKSFSFLASAGLLLGKMRPSTISRLLNGPRKHGFSRSAEMMSRSPEKTQRIIDSIRKDAAIKRSLAAKAKYKAANRTERIIRRIRNSTPPVNTPPAAIETLQAKTSMLTRFRSWFARSPVSGTQELVSVS
ncbi:MAG: hypothetical protein OXU45_00415 [Candidatus Melainabacteria bacterium]|nr:hypothetical protein [Candidatus Melainabacteria bacterium]